MKEKDLKNILREDFSFEKNWKPIFSLLFNKVQYFTNASNPFEEQSKVKSGKQTGVVKLDDGKSLAIFEVEVDDSIHIDRNRQGLREIAIKHIDQNITHGALVFFYSKNQADYRFSFIAKWSEIDLETGEFIKGETKPKRYTYLLGDNEACTTAAKRLLILAKKKETQDIGIKEVIDAFAVEPLKNDFFKTYKEHYEKFWRYIANAENGYRTILLDTSKENVELQEKPIRDFAKKLLGRIVFLHFLQKKGWMGCPANTKKWEGGDKQFMQNLFNEFQNKQKFHSKCLTKLFFNTLNTIRENDVLEIEGLKGKLNGSRVPYLNGGLFDTDKPKETQSIDFPEKFFFELLDFFEQYNFTIDENSPDDHEVGIDPEMLGHIFENLLEENREKGAFYTPKEVVQYMCKESIIQYLNNHFNVADDIENFVRNHSVSGFFADRDNAVELNDKLSAIKVCDPAIGSGAFPIGMLQEIFEAKKFIYPYLKTNKEFNPAQVKKDIIQNSIYGVDLEKGAVDIAQLRFWLALVVDETIPHPLPNLDYKIMQGNSLLESYEGIDLSKAALFEEPNVTIVNPTLFEEPKTEYGFSEKNRNDIKQLISNYFKEEDKDQKQQIRKNIDRIVLDHIDKSLEFHENRLLIEIADYEKRLENKTEQLTEKQKEKYFAKSKEVKEIDKRKKQLANRTVARKKLLDFEKTDERPYFLWHLFFMDVFEKGGFDVMIGNPPYRQIQTMDISEKTLLESANFKTFTRTGDIYCLFYEKGFEYLKNDGVLTYITSNSWLKTKYGKPLRVFFSEECSPQKLLNFEDTKIFPAATVEVNILSALKAIRTKPMLAVTFNDNYNLKTSIVDFFNKNHFEISDFDENGWVISGKEEMVIKQGLEGVGKPLKDWDVSIYIGILNGFNDAFIIKTEVRDEIIKSNPKANEIVRPILRGRDLKKYTYKWDDLWLINTHNGIKKLGIERVNVEQDYPEIFELLRPYQEQLEIRKNKGDHWTNLRNCAYFFEFDKPKIIWGELSDIPKFAYDESGMYAEATLFAMTGKNLKYLLTILNSRIALWYFNQITTTSGMGTSRWKKYKIEQLPIPQISNSEMKPFEIIADYLTFIIEPNNQDVFEHASNDIISRFFEDVLNMMVYELYFEEHMKKNEIDVLKFVDFKDICQLQSFEEKRNVIQKEYYKLKEKDNPIRNRILVSESRSTIIKRINETTH